MYGMVSQAGYDPLVESAWVGGSAQIEIPGGSTITIAGGEGAPQPVPTSRVYGGGVTYSDPGVSRSFFSFGMLLLILLLAWLFFR